MKKSVILFALPFLLMGCTPEKKTTVNGTSDTASGYNSSDAVSTSFSSASENVTKISSVNTATSSTSDEELTEMEKIYVKYDSSYREKNYKIEKVGVKEGFLNCVDVSFENAITEGGQVFYDSNGNKKDFYAILKENGVNCVRIRLYHDYTSSTGSLNNGDLNVTNVLKMAKKAKEQGLKFILDIQYSDTWADPDNQSCPYAWKDMSYDECKEALYSYTKDTFNTFTENGVGIDYVQIGNEINSGMCFPFGKIDFTSSETESSSFDNLVGLLSNGAKAVREVSPETKIIIHLSNALDQYNQIANGIWFFDELQSRNLDYDIIGSSFYTFYTTTTKISQLTPLVNQLTSKYSKPFMMMENSYGYTTAYGDNCPNYLYTTNCESNYPLTIQGQTNEIVDIYKQLNAADNCIGYSYWGGEWIPSEKVENNNWENQALFTFDGYALPTLSVFKNM